LSISIRHLRGRKLDRQAALGVVSARFRSLSILQSRGFPTQDGHKLLILRTSVLKLAPFGSDPNGANLSRLSISIRHLRGRKLDRQAALGVVSARFRSLSILQSRGFPTQDGHKLLILRTSVLKLAPFGSDPYI
jgi:hypothetical protein